MQWLDRILNLMRQRPQGQRTYIGSRQGGLLVNEDSAQTYSWISACVRLRSNTMGALPWQVFKRLATGREAQPQNGIQWLLNFQANPEQTAFVFRRTLVANLDLWGNGYAEIERGMDGRAVWLWPLPPDRSCLDRSETGELNLRVSMNGGQYVLPRANVFMLSEGSHDGITGVSRIQLARRSIGAGMAGDQMASSVFQNGAAGGAIITQKTGKTLTPEAKDLMLKTFNERNVGPNNAGRTEYLDAGMELQDRKLMPMVDMQFIENRRFQGEEICRWYDTPLHLVQDTSQANYAISYEASKNFVEHTLRPLAVLMEQEANVRLFGLRNQGQIYSRMNLAGLLRADPKTRGEYYRSLINAGIMSINEVRELEELNSIGADGDEHYIQLNMTTLGKVAEGANMPSAQPALAPAAPDPQPVNVTIGSPIINVSQPDVHVAAPTVNYTAPEVNVAAPNVTVEPTVVNVAAAEVHVPATVVTLPAPIVNVAAPIVNMPSDGPRETIITERDPVTNLAKRSINRPIKVA